MGKIIEFKNEHELELGMKLYVVARMESNKYKPCPVCENKRLVAVTDIHDNSYEMPCPRCSKLSVKGGSAIKVNSYKVFETSISSFNYSVKSKFTIGTNYNYELGKHVFSTEITNVENMTAESPSYASSQYITYYYFTEEEAKAKCKELTAIENEKRKKFMETE